MKKHVVRCVCSTRDLLGESPTWLKEQNSLYWVDIKRCLIHKINFHNNKESSWQFNEQLGCIAHYKDNIFIAGTKRGFMFVDLTTNELIPIINPEKTLINNRFNDGKCDTLGRFYAGTMNDQDNKPTGSFYILYNDLICKKIDSGYIVSNGPTFSPDYRKIYLTDTRKGEIYCSDIKDDGTLFNKKILITIPQNEGRPDGMTVDEEGYLWIALFGGSCVNRYNTLGKKVEQIKLPVSCVTSCVFGGQNLNLLFITTASFKLSAEQKNNEPEAGSLFCVKLETKGLKTNKFIMRSN